MKSDDWQNLSLREKIGQTMLMLPERGQELKLGNGSLEGFFERYPVTGYFMGWNLFKGVEREQKCDAQLRWIEECCAASCRPLIFQQDYERGIDLPGLTPFPNEMSLGATDSEDLAYAYGQAVGREARSVGISWVLHPVADLNLNRLNPVTNTRAVSDDPDRVIRLLKAQIAGLQEQGVAATIKHFPGDGVDYRNQHFVTTCNSLPMDDWRKLHGRVFQELSDHGAAALMPGHITLPAYQKERRGGLCLPATLSHELLTVLLKKEMGFAGVVVSDAMCMAGFRGWYESELEGEVQSFLAGVDVMLWPSYGFMDEVERRIEGGEIPMERLDDAVSRIWRMKAQLGILDDEYATVQPVSPEQLASHRQAAAAICSKAVTSIRLDGTLVPIDRKTVRRICLVAVTATGSLSGHRHLDELAHTRELLSNEGFDVDFQHNLLYEDQGWTESLSAQYDLVLFMFGRGTHSPMQVYEDEAQSTWGINAMPKEKVVVVSYGDPYLVEDYFLRVPNCINAYSTSHAMQEAAVNVLLGRVEPCGTSPVSFNATCPINAVWHI